jgi:hypothetical protein
MSFFKRAETLQQLALLPRRVLSEGEELPNFLAAPDSKKGEHQELPKFLAVPMRTFLEREELPKNFGSSTSQDIDSAKSCEKIGVIST